MDEKEVPYTHDPKQPFNWVRVRMIGGKSLFWARMSFRLSDYEFKAKDHDGFGENWPISYADLAPFYSTGGADLPRARAQGRLAAASRWQLHRGQFADSEVDEAIRRGGARHAASPVTKMRRALGNGQFASSLNLLLPDAVATGNLTIVPNAVVRDITVDKNTGLVNGAHFLDRHSRPGNACQGARGGGGRIAAWRARAFC